MENNDIEEIINRVMSSGTYEDGGVEMADMRFILEQEKHLLINELQTLIANREKKAVEAFAEFQHNNIWKELGDSNVTLAKEFSKQLQEELDAYLAQQEATSDEHIKWINDNNFDYKIHKLEDK